MGRRLRVSGGGIHRYTILDTVQYQGPCTVGTEDMDTSQATSHVPLSTHMVVGSSISTEFVDYSPDVNIIY